MRLIQILRDAISTKLERRRKRRELSFHSGSGANRSGRTGAKSAAAERAQGLGAAHRDAGGGGM